MAADDTGFFGYAHRRRTQSLRHDDSSFGGKESATLAVAFWPRHVSECTGERLDGHLQTLLPALTLTESDSDRVGSAFVFLGEFGKLFPPELCRD